MAYSGDRFTTTNLDAVINEIWAPQVEREWQANLVFANFFTDVSDQYAGGGDNLNISGIYTNQLSAKTKSGGSEVTLQSATMDSVTLSVDTWKEISFIFEDFEAQLVLRNAKVAQEYADQARYILAKALDSAIATALNAGLSASVGSDHDNLTDGIVRDAIEQVDADDIPMEEMAFFMHPTTVWHDLYGEDKYYKYDRSTEILTGNFGPYKRQPKMLYEIPVLKSSIVPKSTEIDNFLAHPKALAFAVVTPGGGVRSQAGYERLKLGTVWISDIIYGIKALRTDAGVVIKSNTSGIVS